MTPAAAAFEIEDVALTYVSDSMAGWQRIRRGRGFAYIDADGRPLRDPAAVRRIRSLAIPPAYEQVWICPLANGHLQATGRDARGRKQYRYHPAWAAQQGQTKFERLSAFGEALPALRRRVRRDLALPGLPQRKVLATLARLLDTTYVRVGNDEYVRENGSFGLTTLRSRHAAVRGSHLELRFRGKSGVPHHVAVDDPALARVVRRCQALPGQELFRYVGDDGEPRRIDSSDVNAYLREAMGGDFTAKDFRTWHASALALEKLLACAPAPTRREAARTVRDVIADVAERLRHTVTVCRKSYVHAAVIATYTDGCLADKCDGATALRGLRRRETRLLAVLEQAAARKERRPPSGRPAARSGARSGARS